MKKKKEKKVKIPEPKTLEGVAEMPDKDITGKGEPGAPVYFSDVNVLEARIKEYFETYICIDEFGNVIRREEEVEKEIPQKDGSVKTVLTKRVVTTLRYPPTLSSLALYLGMERETLLNYSKSQAFFSTIKKAKDRIHSFNENTLYNKQANTVGVIFNLKNNFGWRDRVENLNVEPPEKNNDMDKTREFLNTWLTPSQPVSQQGEVKPVENVDNPVSNVDNSGKVEKKKGLTLDEAEALASQGKQLPVSAEEEIDEEDY